MRAATAVLLASIIGFLGMGIHRRLVAAQNGGVDAIVTRCPQARRGPVRIARADIRWRL